MTERGADARLRVREPVGVRELDLPISIGARGAQVLVPGVEHGATLSVALREGELHVKADGVALNLNGQTVAAEQALRSGDVLRFGDAHLILQRIADGRTELEVRHLAGNHTPPPLSPFASTETDLDNEDASVRPELVVGGPNKPATTASPPAARATRRVPAGWWVAVALLLALLLTWLAQLQTVVVVLSPADARVRADGLISWQSAGSLLLMPGERQLRVTRPGYRTLRRTISVKAGAPNNVQLVLQKLPGVLDVDTGAVAATALLDGAEIGRVPGALQVAAGAHTLLLRAERHLDAVLQVEVAGMAQHQAIKARLEPSWGRLTLASDTPAARLSVNDGEALTLPAAVDLPAGVQRLKVSAPGSRDWLSSVLIKPGATTAVGPIVLGAPDAQLSVRSQPVGAAVIVGGVWRGRAPLQLALPPGAHYEVLVSQPGYVSFTRVVEATAGAKLAVDARLAPILVGLSISGEPADGELWIDGVARGRAPATQQLLAGAHRVEVRHAGMQAWISSIDLAPGVARTLEYRLVPEGRPAGWTPPASTITSKAGPALKLISGGSFLLGSARREQGRRPNEGQLRVTLSRPFYIGLREVTNAEFRRFRADHVSGVVDQRSVDLDNQPVSNVTWEQAVEYCNWLSAQDGLVSAYESKDGSWVLRQPANIGYRLPTEAEWEFAARMGGGRARRFEWGDELPIPPGVANIAGAEAAKMIDPVLPAYRDEYVGVAPVGHFPPNAFGLFDMTGNVSEWTHDVYTSFLDGATVTDPLGPPAGARHTVRGASWRSATISELRLAWREGGSEPTQDLGFRVARYAE